MRAGPIVRVAALAVLAAAVLPEVPRYRAERSLVRAASALRITLAGGAPDRLSALVWTERTAADAARHLPGDPRPLVVAGSARLAARDPGAALGWYARAQATGERAEIDLNIGRARMVQRDLTAAQQAFLRAGWLSPLLLAELPEVARVPLLGEIDRLGALLATGRLDSPPPPPDAVETTTPGPR
ncbi:MAG: hypothetical protein HY825_15445 [Acidobacteria bacterium]|nr:hypothetical protein [Acidobacteriota bacterium]